MKPSLSFTSLFIGFTILLVVVCIAAKIVQSKAEDAAHHVAIVADAVEQNANSISKMNSSKPPCDQLVEKDIPDLTTQRFVGPAPAPALTKEVFQSFHLALTRTDDLSKQAADYAGLQNIQDNGVTTQKGEGYAVTEFAIRDRKALMYALGDTLLKVGDREVYVREESDGMVRAVGLFLVSQSRVLLVKHGDWQWDLDMDPDMIHFIKNVPLP
ncbi:MAG: hypothetical protein WC477_03765 [Patescibacteria group bacterium]